MRIKNKLEALVQIYALYDTFTDGLTLACRKRCTACCTTNVTLTTLEALHLWQQLDAAGRTELQKRLNGASASSRFRPTISTNRLAEICAAGGDPPEEEAEPTARCPLLAAEMCWVYGLRPFHCRCMVSQQRCDTSQASVMTPFTLTVNSVFLQVIEHLDTPGCSGNALDVLPVISADHSRRSYTEGALDCRQAGLVANRPLKVLMVPPEHRDRLAPLLEKLRSVRI